MRDARSSFVLLTFGAIAACVTRAHIPDPASPLVMTPSEVLAGPPDDSTSMDVLRIRYVEDDLANGTAVTYALRRTDGMASVFVGSRRTSREHVDSRDAASHAVAYALERRGDAMEEFGTSGAPRWLVDADGIRTTVRVPSGSLAGTIRQLEILLREGAIREPDVATFRRWCEETVAASRSSLDDVIAASLRRLLYAESDPRRATVDAQRERCRELSLDAVETRRRELLDPSSLVVVVAGEFDTDDVRATIASTFGGWPATSSASERPDPRSVRDSEMRAIGYERPLMRTWLTMLERAPPRGDEDYAAFLVIDKLLGGMFGSRSNLSIREASGAAYGVTTSYRTTCAEGELRISTHIDPAFSRSALVLFVDELRRVSGDAPGIGDAEFARAKSLTYESVAFTLDDSRSLAATIGEHALCRLPAARLVELLDAIDALTIDDVERVARRHLRPDRAPIVLVGSDWELRLAAGVLGYRAIDVLAAPELRRR